MDLALNNQQMLICHKTQPNQPTNQPTLLLVELLAVTWVPCILRHPI